MILHSYTDGTAFLIPAESIVLAEDQTDPESPDRTITAVFSKMMMTKPVVIGTNKVTGEPVRDEITKLIVIPQRVKETVKTVDELRTNELRSLFGHSRATVTPLHSVSKES